MEIDFLYYMKILAVTTITFIIYRLLIQENKAKTKDHYTRPAWNFFLKKLYAQYVLNKDKKRQLRFVKELKRYENEAPKILPNEESTDSQKIFGTDHEGNSILLKFIRRKHRIAEVWFILRLKCDQSYVTYTLPDHPHTKIPNSHPELFEGLGLKLECLVPYTSWRITYTGMLRKGISQVLSDDETNYHFVKLNFIWTAANDPIFWPYEWNTGLIAAALATEKWRDGKWKNLINLNDSGGYDQFGACKGEVRIFENNYVAYMEGQLPKVEIKELNLPGLRHRRWGPHKNETLHRTGIIFGSMKDGTVIEVGAFSSKIGVTHSQFGNVRTCTGDILPIEWTDFQLAAIGEYQDQLPQATIVEIEAGNHTFIAVITFKNNEKVPLFGGYVGEKWNAFVVPVDIVCNTIRGYGMAVFWYPRNMRKFEFEEMPTKIKRIFHRNDMPTPEKQLVSFADKEAQSISVAGGKGCSLAILRIIQETKGENLIDHRGRNFQVLNALVDQFSTSGLQMKILSKHLLVNEPPKTGRQRSGSITKTIFPDPNDVDTPDFFVPQGFILSVSAYEEHLKNHIQIRKAIKELESIAYEKVDGSLEIACRRVHEIFMSTAISDDLKAAITPKLDQINFDTKARFAVRSSGLTEDTEELSAAGQNQTFLGLKTHKEIFEAIIKCWSSIYSFQSVLYRKQNIQPVVSSMAVVIQKMVSPESAGVLFSRHFLNGDPSVIIVTANYGLGESVVSAKSDPDTYLIKRCYKGENLKMLAAIPGDKKFTIEMNDSSVTEKILDDEKRSKLCLSEDVVLRLAKIAVVLEKFYGSPRDIEFAVTPDKRIFLLQSRTITALNNFTDYEIAHETDSAIMSNWVICTRANVGEVLNGAVSKLSRSMITKSIERINAELIQSKPLSPLYSDFYHCSNDTIFMDIYNQFLRSIGKSPTVMDRALSMSIFGNDIFTEYPQIMEIMTHKNSFQNKMKLALMKLKFFVICGFHIDHFRDEMSKALQRMKIRLSEQNLLKYKTPSDILDLIVRELENFVIVVRGHLYSSSYSVLFNALIFGVLTRGSKELTTIHQRDVAVILSSIGNIESANVPEMIREIATSIKSSGKESQFIDQSDEHCVIWMKYNASDAYQLFQKFMDRHGHRTFKEFDLISKTWSMQPEKVIQMIKSNLKIMSEANNLYKEKKEVDVIDRLKTPLTNTSKLILKKLISKSHKGVQCRETAKSQLIDAVNELRRGIIYLSKKLVNEGLLPEHDLIYHLTIQEIKAIIKNRSASLINRAFRRQKFYATHDELLFDEICFGVPKPMSELNNQIEVKDGDIIVKGMPVCGGKVTARACVFKNFSEIHQLQKGDILITYCTDIAWSPYFNMISGICTEIGGLVSHGAVVARECNLPCIVGASRATDKIKHGDRIYLNADDGIIVKVE